MNTHFTGLRNLEAYTFILNKVRNLRNTERYNGNRLIFPENTPTHSMDMYIIGLLLINKFNLWKIYDIMEVSFRCNNHDIDESVLCDMPRKLKYADRSIAKKINKFTMGLLSNHFPKRFINLIKNSKDATKMGHFIKMLDILQAHLKLVEEVIFLNNYMLLDILIENTTYFESTLDSLNLPKNLKLYLIDLLLSTKTYLGIC